LYLCSNRRPSRSLWWKGPLGSRALQGLAIRSAFSISEYESLLGSVSVGDAAPAGSAVHAEFLAGWCSTVHLAAQVAESAPLDAAEECGSSKQLRNLLASSVHPRRAAGPPAPAASRAEPVAEQRGQAEEAPAASRVEQLRQLILEKSRILGLIEVPSSEEAPAALRAEPAAKQRGQAEEAPAASRAAAAAKQRGQAEEAPAASRAEQELRQLILEKRRTVSLLNQQCLAVQEGLGYTLTRVTPNTDLRVTPNTPLRQAEEEADLSVLGLQAVLRVLQEQELGALSFLSLVQREERQQEEAAAQVRADAHAAELLAELDREQQQKKAQQQRKKEKRKQQQVGARQAYGSVRRTLHSARTGRCCCTCALP
jgi:hypothetical protein